MKSIVSTAVVFFLFFLFILGAHSQSVTTNWALKITVPTNTIPVFDHYIPGTNQAYNVYGTTNIGSISGWPLLAYWTNWSVIANGDGSFSYSNMIALPPGVWYVAFTGTNQSGESFFSPVALTGPLPVAPSSVSMQKAQ